MNPITDFWRSAFRAAESAHEHASDFSGLLVRPDSEAFRSGELALFMFHVERFLDGLTASDRAAFDLAYGCLLTEPNWPPLTRELVTRYRTFLDHALAWSPSGEAGEAGLTTEWEG